MTNEVYFQLFHFKITKTSRRVPTKTKINRKERKSNINPHKPIPNRGPRKSSLHPNRKLTQDDDNLSRRYKSRTHSTQKEQSSQNQALNSSKSKILKQKSKPRIQPVKKDTESPPIHIAKIPMVVLQYMIQLTKLHSNLSNNNSAIIITQETIQN